MEPLVSWMNANAGAVSAAAAVAGAIATVTIAALTISTVSLYRLERRREEGLKGSLAGHLIRLMNHFRSSADLLEAATRHDPDFGGSGKKAVHFIFEENGRRRAHIESLFDRAAATKMEVTAALDAVLVLLIGMEGLFEEIITRPEATVHRAMAAKQLKIELRDAASCCERAYRALPSKSRRWAGGNKGYDALVHEFIGPTRDRMMGKPIKGSSAS